jgi:hypothetical protein
MEQGTPSAGRDIALPADPPSTTDALIAEWLEHCTSRPPGSVIGQVGKQVKAMLAEGIDPADVRRGLAAWAKKGLHPSTLPSVINEVMNAPTARASPSTRDRKVTATLALADQLEGSTP